MGKREMDNGTWTTTYLTILLQACRFLTAAHDSLLCLNCHLIPSQNVVDRFIPLRLVLLVIITVRAVAVFAKFLRGQALAVELEATSLFAIAAQFFL